VLPARALRFFGIDAGNVNATSAETAGAKVSGCFGLAVFDCQEIAR
jgi:hypothetical protein